MTSSVCFLGYGLHPPWSEGTRVVTRDLMASLDTTDWDVFAVSSIRNSVTPTENISYVRESVLGDLVDAMGGYRYNLDAILLFRMGRRLRGIVRQEDIGVIHAGFASHTWFSLINDLALKRTFVAHTFGGIEHAPVLRLLNTTSRIDAYVSSSQGDLDQLSDLGVERDKLHHIPVPVFTEHFDQIDANEARDQFGLDEDAFVVGYIGNVNRSRFPIEFANRLDSFAEGHRVEAFVVTKQIEGKDIRKFEHLNTFVRPLSDKEKWLAYRAADVWVFPFQFDSTEAPIIDPPLTVLEAMASGRPVVATSTLSLPTIIDAGRNGYLCPEGEFTCLFERLRELRDNPTTRADVGREGQRTIERNHDPKLVGTRLQEIYHEAKK